MSFGSLKPHVVTFMLCLKLKWLSNWAIFVLSRGSRGSLNENQSLKYSFFPLFIEILTTSLSLSSRSSSQSKHDGGVSSSYNQGQPEQQQQPIKHWQVGEQCRALWGTDGNYHEATITEIYSSGVATTTSIIYWFHDTSGFFWTFFRL